MFIVTEYAALTLVNLNILSYNTPSNVILLTCSIMQLMHSFDVNIRICWLENSDVYWGEDEVNIIFEGWLILVLTENECTNSFVIWHCPSFPNFIASLFI